MQNRKDQSVRSYLRDLEAAGQLTRITKTVDPDVDLSAVAFKAYAELGKATIYDNIKGHDGWRAMSQIVADRGMWATALGVPEDQAMSALAARMKGTLPCETVSKAEATCKENILIGDDVDLRKLPAIWTSERDPGRYIAAGMCFIRNPETGVRNISIHRAQIMGRNKTGFLMLPRQAARIAAICKKLGRPMEVAMVVGAHPLIIFSSAFVAPFGTDELTIASSLLQEPVRTVRCETIDMEVPADAELVLEGTVSLEEVAPEGPFGEVTGTYGYGGDLPVFTVKAMTYRNDPIFYAISCGLPPNDAQSIVAVTIEMKLFQHLAGLDAGRLNVKDIRCLGGVSPLLVILQLKDPLPGHAQLAMTAALSSPFLHPKFVIAVDEDVDPSSIEDVLWALATRVDPARDVVKINDTRVFGLDNASELESETISSRIGTKMMIDATRPVSGDVKRYERAKPVVTAKTVSRSAWAAGLNLSEEGLLNALRTRLLEASPGVKHGVFARGLKETSADKWPLSLQCEKDEAQSASVHLFCTDATSGEPLVARVRLMRAADGALSIGDLPHWLAPQLKKGARFVLAGGAGDAISLAAELAHLRPQFSLLQAASLVGRELACAELDGIQVPADIGYALICESAGTTATLRMGSISGVYRDVTALRITCVKAMQGADAPSEAPMAARMLAQEVAIYNHICQIEGGLDVIDVRCYAASGGMVAAVKLRGHLRGQAKTGLLGTLSGVTPDVKLVIGVDEDVNLDDPRDIFWSFASRTHAKTDVEVLPNMPASSLDPTSEKVMARWLIDSTMPPLSQPDLRSVFERATPKNLGKVSLDGFL